MPSQTNTKPTWKVKVLTIAFCCFAPTPPQIFSSEAQTGLQGSLRIIRTQACISASRFSWNFQVVSSNRKPLFPAPVVAPQYEHSSKDLVKRNDPKPKDAIFEHWAVGKPIGSAKLTSWGKALAAAVQTPTPGRLTNSPSTQHGQLPGVWARATADSNCATWEYEGRRGRRSVCLMCLGKHQQPTRNTTAALISFALRHI